MPDFEFRPILSAMRRNPIGAILIALQVAFTLGVVANALFIINDRVELITRPTGFDVANIAAINNTFLDEPSDKQAAIRADLAALEAIPGVVAATAMNHLPLSGSGWGADLCATGEEDAPAVDGARFVMTETGQKAMGLELSAGRWFRADEVRQVESWNEPFDVIIITRPMAEELFPDGDALGKPVYDNLGRPITVIGIVDHMQGSWINWEDLDNNSIVPIIHRK